MSELETADDPRALVPGDPAQVWKMADSFERIGVAFEDIGLGFRTIDTGDWRGAAADAFHACAESQPKRFLVAADAFTTAAAALDMYASALSWAQRQAAEAIALTTSAESAADDGTNPPPRRLTLREQVEWTGVVSGDVPATAAPSRKTLRLAAADTLNRARAQVQRIGREAARQLRAASALAPRRVDLREVVAPATVTTRDPALAVTARAVLRAVPHLDAAAHHPDALFKRYLAHETLRDAPADWEAGIAALRKRLRRRELDQLSPRLRQHLFDGHLKARPRGRGYRELGYHHREGGIDRGPVRVLEIVAAPDAHGVYRARVAGPRTEGGSEVKVSTFFPDAWTRVEVERAVRHAFLTRTHFDARNSTIRRKWRGIYRGVLIEGYVETTTDARSARLYHVVTAYPVHRGGRSPGQVD